VTHASGTLRSVGALLVFLLLLAPALSTAGSIGRVRLQDPVLLVRVVDVASGRPLPNAEVRSVDDERRQLTNAMGEARLAWPPARTMRIRVRQIGFRFAERTVRAREGSAADTAEFALERVPIMLPELVSTARQPCETNEDPEIARLSVLALEHLQLAAEHYRQFEKSYPFEVRIERRTAYLRADTTAQKIYVREERARSDQFGERYERGEVVNRRRAGWDAKLLFIEALADPGFWESHCLAVRGVEQRDARRLIRLDFAPVAELKAPDWAGTAWLDSATSVMLRLDFHLTGLEGRTDPGRLEGYTTFVQPTAFITFPDTTLAYWWTKRPDASGEWGTPNVVQLLKVKEVKYRKETPP
jgi:hypothetical protein